MNVEIKIFSTGYNLYWWRLVLTEVGFVLVEDRGGSLTVSYLGTGFLCL